MKKTYLAVLAICIAASASAQKNSILLYGNLGISSLNSKDSSGQNDHQNRFYINPGIGYQFSDHFTAGLALGFSTFSRSSVSDHSSGMVKTNEHGVSYSTGAFLRYTTPISDLFFFYGQFEGSYTSTKAKYNTIAQVERDGGGLKAALTPALGVNINKGLALTLDIGGLGYVYEKNTFAASSQSNIVLNFGQVINIGISKNFALKARKTKASD